MDAAQYLRKSRMEEGMDTEEVLAKHRKVHLFDIDVAGGQSFRESDTLSPGNAITTFETAFGGIYGYYWCIWFW